MEKMNREEVLERVIAIVSECGEVPAKELKTGELLNRYGIDSLAAVNIAYEIGLLMGRDVPEDLLTKYNTIDKLIDYILS